MIITTINEFKLILESLNFDTNFKVFTADEFKKLYSNDPRFILKIDGGKKAFKYYQYSDYNDEPKIYFFGLEIDNVLVALGHIRQTKNINQYKLSYLCVDALYEGKGYASMLAENIFKWFSKNNYTFETTKYTEIGFIKLKPLFNKLAQKYNVNFIDKGKF